ncbi:MAG: hypothetical protein K6G79_04685 [Bacteroidales bacterium]|nr:hypothetical protein [Bacteroidales bacterium]
MNGIKHIIRVTAVLLAALSTLSCDFRSLGHDNAELMVSLYVPDAVMTKAETGQVDPISGEKAFKTLHVWAFLHSDGSLVSYRAFDDRLDDTGLPNTALTRFGLPLTEPMFNTLASGATVDVYAVANAAAATGTTLDESTTRSELDGIVITGDYFGATTLTTLSSLTGTGIPMSGKMTDVTVTGGYPVLRTSNNLTLVRTVSKIRFVFCQQEHPAEGSNPAVPVNDKCRIISISFDGTDNGKDCQIAASEKLFTTKTTSGSLFDIGDTEPYSYTPLNTTISGTSGPLISNSQLAMAEDPEVYLFRSLNHSSETAQQYETRIDAAIASESQYGPIYIRETDKKISGTITYNTTTDGQDQTATFSMDDGDLFSRNHSWIVYAYFAQETKTLQLKVKVLPWDYTDHPIDYTTGSVNVVRRFSVLETTPMTFRKETNGDFIDIFFWDTVEVENQQTVHNIIKGDIIIATPVGAKLHAIAVPGVIDHNPPYQPVTTAIQVKAVSAVPGEPAAAIIYPNFANMADGRIEDCKIEFTIECNREIPGGGGQYSDEQLEGNYIDLHLCVEIGEGLRFIDLGSESLDHYRFILKKNWQQP